MPQSYCTPHRQSVILDVEGGVKHEWSRMCVSAREQHFIPQFFFFLSLSSIQLWWNPDWHRIYANNLETIQYMIHLNITISNLWQSTISIFIIISISFSITQKQKYKKWKKNAWLVHHFCIARFLCIIITQKQLSIWIHVEQNVSVITYYFINTILLLLLLLVYKFWWEQQRNWKQQFDFVSITTFWSFNWILC